MSTGSYSISQPKGAKPFWTARRQTGLKMFLLVPVAGRIISFFAKDNKDEEESKWSEKLDQQSYALNPALLAQYANEMEVKGSDKKEKLKYPYITLTSTSVIAIPYATKFYPVTL